jgi:hypothetical protein
MDQDVKDPLLRKADLVNSWNCLDIVRKIPCKCEDDIVIDLSAVNESFEVKEKCF